MPPRPAPSRRTGALLSRSARLAVVLAALTIGGGIGTWRAIASRPSTAPPSLHYRVEITDPATARVDVTLHVEPVPHGRVDLTFSRTSIAPTAPASKFRVREAFDAQGRTLAIEPHPGGWRVRGHDAIEIHYGVHLDAGRGTSEYADEALSRLEAGGGRLLGSDVFLFPDVEDAREVTVDYVLPDGWDLHHPFPDGRTGGRPPTLRSLYGSVVAIGPYRTLTRQVGPCRIELAIRGRFAFGDDDLMQVIERIVRHQVEFFGQAPRERYLFVVDEHPDATDPSLLHYFGLHFDASMLVLLDPRTSRRDLTAEPASLCAHEFFHNWLGEQLRQENYAMNWFVEGVTTLYAYRTRLATRMLDHGRYARQLRERFDEHWASASVRSQLTLADAGTIVLQDQAVTRMLYTGGLLAAVALDEAIVHATRGEASLDDVLIALVARAADEPDFRLTRASLEAELTAVTGEDFAPWLDRHVYGMDDLPLPGYVTGR